MNHAIIVPCRSMHWQESRRIFDVTEPAEWILVSDLPNEGPFNKAAALNEGINRACCGWVRPDVLTFMDADMLVGPRFLESQQRLMDDPGLTILCYRVRNADTADVDWTRYDDYPKAFEAYGDPEHGAAHPDMRPIFGNSQFSIRREVLDDLRWDEGYAGRGFEDLDMTQQIWQRYGSAYRAEIMTDADHALLHVAHAYDPGWADRKLTTANLKRYKEKWHGC